MKLELGLAGEVAPGLGADLALDVVGAKDRLLQLHVLEGDEGEGKGLHGVVLLLGVEDHPVRGEVEPALLLPPELGPVLARELHLDVVAEQEDALPRVDQDAAVGVSRVESHSLVSQNVSSLSAKLFQCCDSVSAAHSSLSSVRPLPLCCYATLH